MFHGDVGKTYGFICIATDTAGNVEVQEPVAETVTKIIAGPGSCQIACVANVITCKDAGQCGAIVNYLPPTTSGDCTGLAIVCSPNCGSFFPIGTTTVSCTATDPSGMTVASCTFTVTVNDCEAPKINCPGNITRPTDPGQCTAGVNYVATATENCPGVTVVCLPPSGTQFPIGSTTVTCTATDAT